MIAFMPPINLTLSIGLTYIVIVFALAVIFLAFIRRRRASSQEPQKLYKMAIQSETPGYEERSINKADPPSRAQASAPQDRLAPQVGNGEVSPVSKASDWVSVQDADFLPAALEILATPPSPIALVLMASISAVVLSGLLWSYFGWIDIYAVAAARLQPTGRSKVVQPFEAGKVTAIHVENGMQVEAGQLLLELDPTESSADREALARDLASTLAEVARRHTAILVAGNYADKTVPAIEFPPEIADTVKRREAAALTLELAELRASVQWFRAQIREKYSSIERLKSSTAARARSIALARERVVMREELSARGAGSRALILEAEQQLEALITTDVGERGQLSEAESAIATLEARLDQAISQFASEQMQKLLEVDKKREKLEQEFVKASTKRERTRLTASISGAVQQLAITTIGQVVTTGQPLMTIVPSASTVEVEARVLNKDIGFVKIGQSAYLKLDAFPFSRFGVVSAKVEKISREAIEDREAQALSDVSSSARPQQGGVLNSTAAQNLVYVVTLGLPKTHIQTDGGDAILTPGMTGTIEIKTGERRAIDFILSPLREMVSETAHER